MELELDLELSESRLKAEKCVENSGSTPLLLEPDDDSDAKPSALNNIAKYPLLDGYDECWLADDPDPKELELMMVISPLLRLLPLRLLLLLLLPMLLLLPLLRLELEQPDLAEEGGLITKEKSPILLLELEQATSRVDNAVEKGWSTSITPELLLAVKSNPSPLPPLRPECEEDEELDENST